MCGGSDWREKYGNLLGCRNCGFITANSALFDFDADAIYSESYFEGGEYTSYANEESALKSNFERRLNDLGRYCGDFSSSRLFEIGSAYGFFLSAAQDRFRGVSGIEISIPASRIARDRFNLDVVTGDYLDMPSDRHQPDLICLWDVIEHLEKPDRYLRKASDEMAPGGVIALTTGDIGSLNARLRGRNWRLIHPPSHLHYFSKATISRLLDRTGFDVIEISYPPVVRTVRMILGRLMGQGFEKCFPVSLLDRFNLLDADISLNLFDIMFVVGRKR